MVIIDITNIAEFTLCYKKAVKNGADSFVFRGSVVMTKYAHFVIDYFKGIELEIANQN